MSRNTQPIEIHCTKCDTIKPACEFGKNAARRNGRTIYCKVCTRQINKVIRKRNNAQRTEYNRKYRDANRAKHNQWERDHYARNKETMAANQKKWRETIGGLATTMHLSARQRARKKGIEYQLSPTTIEALIKMQGERCKLTGIRFEYQHSEKYNKRPWVPSIDRIDNSRGYTFDNVHIVCHVVNLAKNILDLEDFDHMCRARVEQLNGR